MSAEGENERVRNAQASRSWRSASKPVLSVVIDGAPYEVKGTHNGRMMVNDRIVAPDFFTSGPRRYLHRAGRFSFQGFPGSCPGRGRTSLEAIGLTGSAPKRFGPSVPFKK